MSLILEALRKSEAERQRGMPPRLDSPMLRPIRRRQRLAPGLALLVLGAPAAGWFVYRGMAPEVDSRETTSLGELALQEMESAPAAAETLPATMVASSDSPGAAASSPVDSTSANTASTPAGPTLAQQRTSALGTPAGLSGSGSFGSELSMPERMRPHTPSVAGSESAPVPVDPAPVAAAPVVAAPPPPPPAAPAAPVVVSDPAPTPPQQVAHVPPPPVAAVPAPAPPPESPAAAGPDADSVPFIYELDFTIRRDLPKMDMNLHVYSADPEARFIVVNGKRYAEGEMAETDVLLREVRRDGAVLVFRGTAFVLPRQGF
jgi:general secretion pathway protein B